MQNLAMFVRAKHLGCQDFWLAGDAVWFKINENVSHKLPCDFGPEHKEAECRINRYAGSVCLAFWYLVHGASADNITRRHQAQLEIIECIKFLNAFGGHDAQKT